MIVNNFTTACFTDFYIYKYCLRKMSNFVFVNEKYLYRCLCLAKKGFGNVQPNPMVGCVIVFNDQIIGEGYHEKYGQVHAEVNAINSVSDRDLLSKSTLYVNLEPCAHFGKTPPCADLIVKSGIPRVVIGTMDPNILVRGKGIEILKKGACQVVSGILEDDCRNLNVRFITFHEKNRPYIILKWAQTKDGFIDVDRSANNENRPTWISNETARILVHKWRSEEQAIMTGTNTARLDNPKLNVRDWPGKNPLRVVLDKELSLSDKLNIFDHSQPSLIVTEKYKKNFENLNYLTLKFDENLTTNIMSHLYKLNIQSVIIEGGSITIQHFININLWDEARIFTGNQSFGSGVKAPEIKGTVYETTNIGDCRLQYLLNR